MATTIENAVCAKLKANAPVNAAVLGRVFPQLNTQEPEFPQIVYSKIGTTGSKRLNVGSGGLKQYTVRVDCYAETEAAADALGKLVRDALSPDGSPWRDADAGVQGCFFEDSVSDFTEDGIRVSGETFNIWFQPTSR